MSVEICRLSLRRAYVKRGSDSKAANLIAHEYNDGRKIGQAIMHGEKLHQRIEHIFRDLFPAGGMTVREEQIALSRRLLDAMLEGKITLCDAGTGIGKTYAYLAAAFAFLRHRSSIGKKFRPLIISTSSIALQTELHKSYIPQLAEILSQDGWEIDLDALSVIRKGKSHYVCDKQLEWRLKQMSKRPSKQKDGLGRLQTEVDMDEAGHIKSYDRKLLQVPRVCQCDRTRCRYLDFLDDCNATPYLFQICNHNLLLADAIRRSLGYRPIFPDNCAVIIDEAHKLPETARQMLNFILTRLSPVWYYESSEWHPGEKWRMILWALLWRLSFSFFTSWQRRNAKK